MKIINPEKKQITYQSSDRNYSVYFKNGYVIKEDNQRLTEDWISKFSEITKLIDLPHLEDFGLGFYKTLYLEGTNLHGDPPFSSGKTGSILNISNKYEVLKIFNTAANIGKILGFTLGDITCGNIILYNNSLYLIDFDIIVQWPLPESYERIWDNTIRIIFNK